MPTSALIDVMLADQAYRARKLLDLRYDGPIPQEEIARCNDMDPYVLNARCEIAFEGVIWANEQFRDQPGKRLEYVQMYREMHKRARATLKRLRGGAR